MVFMLRNVKECFSIFLIFFYKESYYKSINMALGKICQLLQILNYIHNYSTTKPLKSLFFKSFDYLSIDFYYADGLLVAFVVIESFHNHVHTYILF